MIKQNVNSLMDDVDEPTPIHSTSTYLSWRNAAAELAEKVKALPGPEATMMYESLVWFEEQFSKWSPQNRPDDATRTRIINDFADLYRSIHEYVSKNRSRSDSVMPRIFNKGKVK